MRWRLVIPHDMWVQLHGHLFPGDRDEHGAVLAAGLAYGPDGVRLLARELFVAEDGIDYVPSRVAYRALHANFVRDKVLFCRDEKLVYLAIHCHGGRDAVHFSGPDLRSHERGYPALLDISGQPVGALVFAENAAAGDIWLPDGQRVELDSVRIVGQRVIDLYPSLPPKPARRDSSYDRQARLFGDRGQERLGSLKVGVIGAGGVGALLIEYLARLGVGHLVIVDPERIALSNVPRIPQSTRWDACALLTEESRPGWMRRFGERFATQKVTHAGRIARRANPDVKLELIPGDFVDEEVAARFTDCDFIFLAADTMQARLVFNAIVHQYLIPGIQVGSKVQTDKGNGDVLDVYSVVRPTYPTPGCLSCNQLIPPARLQDEALSEAERKAQRYVDEPEVAVPSVITLNAQGAGNAANEFLFAVTGLRSESAESRSMYFRSLSGEVERNEWGASPTCPHCSTHSKSRRARGDAKKLPVRPKGSHRNA